MGNMNHMDYHRMGYLMPPSGFHMNFNNPLTGFSNIDPACGEKFPLVWGLKSGELPPATPDPQQMFKDGGYYPFRYPMRNQMFPPDKMFNYSMNSPMFIPNILNEASPRVPPTRQYYQGGNQNQPGLNFTFNLNVNGGDYR
jgi:hypothetical protein